MLCFSCPQTALISESLLLVRGPVGKQATKPIKQSGMDTLALMVYSDGQSSTLTQSRPTPPPPRDGHKQTPNTNPCRHLGNWRARQPPSSYVLLRTSTPAVQRVLARSWELYLHGPVAFPQKPKVFPHFKSLITWAIICFGGKTTMYLLDIRAKQTRSRRKLENLRKN